MTEPTSSERGARVRFPPPVVFLIGVLAGVALRYVVAPPRAPVDWTIRVAFGALILVCGLSLVGWASILFSRTGQDPAPWKPTPELVFKGPYRFTRNPMYVGMTLFEVGLGVALNNLWVSLLAVPALVVVHFIAVLPEEKYLSDKFGESYKQYLARVRRYL